MLKSRGGLNFVGEQRQRVTHFIVVLQLILLSSFKSNAKFSLDSGIKQTSSKESENVSLIGAGCVNRHSKVDFEAVFKAYI